MAEKWKKVTKIGYFSPINRNFLLLRGTNRYTAGETGTAREPGSCRAVSYEEQRRGTDQRYLHGFPRQMGNLFSSESSWTQKLNETTAELSFGWVFGVQLGLQQTQ